MAQGSGALTGAALGLTLGAVGGFLQERQQRRFRRRQRRAIQAARDFAQETVRGIQESDLFSGATEFITSTFQDAGDSPLAQDFAKSIQAAQSARGTFTGNLAAAQEAVGRSAAAQRLRAQLLPAAQQFAEAPERLRQSVLSTEAPLRVAAATGAPIAGLGGPPQLSSPLGSAISGGLSGAIGGFQLGSQFDSQQRFDARLEGLRKQRAGRLGSSNLSGFGGLLSPQLSSPQVAAPSSSVDSIIQSLTAAGP